MDVADASVAGVCERFRDPAVRFHRRLLPPASRSAAGGNDGGSRRGEPCASTRPMPEVAPMTTATRPERSKRSDGIFSVSRNDCSPDSTAGLNDLLNDSFKNSA